MNSLQDYLKTKTIILIVSSLFTLLYSSYQAYSAYTEMQLVKTKNRQLQGFLSQKEQQLLEQKEDFNIAKGKLESSVKVLEEEASEFRERYTDLNADYQKFVSENDLRLIQYQKRIYSLKQKIKTSPTSNQQVKIITKEGKCDKQTIISYLYTDPSNRITFKTPNCLKKGGEEITLNQTFTIYGEVHKQKDGLLKVSSLTLREVDTKSNKVIASAKLLSSDFKFIDDSSDLKTEEAFLTLGVGYSSKHLEAFNLGYNFYNYSNLDLNLSLNYTYPSAIYPSLKLIYRPVILGRKLNLGVSAGAGYDFENLPFYMLGVDFVAW
jgi:hypothetical protein